MKSLREQVDSFSVFNERLIEQTDVPVLLSRLQFQIQKYEHTMDSQLKKCTQLKNDINIRQKPYHDYIRYDYIRQKPYHDSNRLMSYDVHNTRQIKQRVFNSQTKVEKQTRSRIDMKPKFMRMSNHPNILKREQRLDPFYQPTPLSNEQFNMGLYRLVN